jgi:AraC-like DNA-binding protein
MRAAMESNIVLVGHNKAELEHLTYCLKDTCRLFVAGNGGELMDRMERVSVQLIVCNADHTGFNGWELCAKLKSSVRYSHIPVILLTDAQSMQVKIKGLQAGADAVMDRPICQDFIKAQVGNLIAGRAKIRDYFTSSPFAHANSVALSNHDGDFLGKMHHFICNNIQNKKFDVGVLSRLMHMSRPTLYRRIQSISDLTPNELINVARLKKAAELLATGDHKVSEVATMVGFYSHSSFGKAFVRQFKITPTEFQHSKKNSANRLRISAPWNTELGLTMPFPGIAAPTG